MLNISVLSGGILPVSRSGHQLREDFSEEATSGDS